MAAVGQAAAAGGFAMGQTTLVPISGQSPMAAGSGGKELVSNTMVPVGGNSQQVSLSLLIEFLVQRIYHDLTVLAELLPRKTDMERKVEIFNFASRSRMLLVRLLALVKWASSASKVDKCNQIMLYLERQSRLFTETADSLALMARETLVRATLPNFHLPAAVEVLTTGRYSRVPRCVRDKIVPPEPITVVEKRETLCRLNQVIEQRLVACSLPPQMRNLKIENGYVTFFVEHEFQATLTLMGDAPNTSWRLLKIKILVYDQETGEGKALTHPMQVGYMEQLIQSRLIDNPKPLQDLYNVLHFMCQSLQLEVLHSQTQKLIFERLGDYIRLEEYKPGKCLTISYWRELLAKGKKDNMSELGYRFSVQVDSQDSSQALSVVHIPCLSADDAQMADRAIRSEHLSLERLLVHSIYVRTKSRLTELKRDIQQRLDLGDVEANLHGSPAVLSIPILQPCLRSEQLLVTVDTHTGVFLAHVPQYEENPFTVDIQATLNDDKSRLEGLVTQLRYWITKQRVHKTLQQLPATSYDRLPILYDLQRHPLKDLSPNKMYIRLHRQPNAILIVEFKEKPTCRCEMDYSYFLLWVKPASIEDDPKDETVSPDIPKVYLKAMSMVEFDPFLVTHSTGTKVDVQELGERITGKRKTAGKADAPIKRTKFPAYFISDLAHVIAFTDERIPFVNLAQELTKKDVFHTGVEIGERAIGLAIKIVKFPKVDGVDACVVQRLEKFLLSVSIRMQQRGGRFWRCEFAFFGNPVAKINNSRTGGRKTVCLTHDVSAEGATEVVDALLQEWFQIVHLFALVDDLEEYLNSDSINLSDVLGIKSYTFKELVLEYGPDHSLSVRVQWHAVTGKFGLVFCGHQQNAAISAHSVMKEQLEDLLNQTQNLALLAKILHDTYSPLKSVSRLPTTPQMGLLMQRTQTPIQTFCVLPQSATHVKILFYNSFCLDVQMRSGSVVLIRDGAISMFDQRKVLEDLHPIQFIKSFLMRYVDESALMRRHSQTEDDNPPSPIAFDEATPVGGLKFPTPHTPPSNPLTPASPHGGFMPSPPAIRQPSPAMPHASPGPGQPIPSPGFAAPSPANPVCSVGSPFPSVHSPIAVGSPGLNRPSPRTAGPIPSPQSQPGSVPGMLSSAFSSHGTGMDRASSQSATSRMLPQRLWAGANPTPVTHKAFEEMCRPVMLMPPAPNLSVPSSEQLCPLNRFLGCVFLRRYIQQYIKSDDSITAVPSNEPGTLIFKMDGLLCRVSSYASNSHQSLHLRAEMDQSYAQQLSPDLIMIMEKFFDTKVAVPPYRPTHVTTFFRILQSPVEVLRDILSILRYEVFPELVMKNGLKWAPKLCLTSTPPASGIIPMGQPGFLRLQDKMLIFLYLSRTSINPALLSGSEPYTVVIPIVYDMKMNTTTVAQKETNQAVTVVQKHLERLSRSGQMNMQRCTILPSVQDLLLNLILPNEGPPHQASSAPIQSINMQGQNAPLMATSTSGNMAANTGPFNPNLAAVGAMRNVITAPMHPGAMNAMAPGSQQQQLPMVGGMVSQLRPMNPNMMGPQRMPQQPWDS